MRSGLSLSNYHSDNAPYQDKLSKPRNLPKSKLFLKSRCIALENTFIHFQASIVKINCIYNNVERSQRCVYTKVKENEMKF
jgi:hypothetical protein